MPVDRQQITAVILAGGKGSRLGGVDKGLITLHKTPLIQHAINRIEPQVNKLIISANRNITLYSDFAYPVFSDDVDGFAGPLAGILKALQQCQTDWLLAVPADSPFIPNDLVAHLSKKIQEHKIAIPHDGNFLHPTFALMHKSLAPSLKHFLQQGERKARIWMQQQDHVIVDISDHPHAFININTQDELEYAEKHFDEFMA